MQNLLFFGICLLTLLSVPAGAALKEVTLYREAARLTELTKVRVRPAGKAFHQCEIIIPGQADPASFMATPLHGDPIKIEDITWRKLANEEGATFKARRRELSQRQEERNGLLADLEGVENQLLFWQQQTKVRAKTPTEAVVISANIGRNTKKALQQKLNVSKEISRLDRRIKEIEAEISDSDGAGQAKWEGTITFSGVAQQEISLSYSYTITGCGWRPCYRLDADLLGEKIKFGWGAEVWQNSGQLWQQVEIRLALFPAPLAAPIPPALSTELNMADAAVPAKRNSSTGKKKLPPAGDSGQDAVEEASVTMPSSGDFFLQPLAGTTLTSGLRTRIILQEESWPVDFDYLARLDYQPQAYLQAHLRRPLEREIPRGDALYYRNGSLLHKGEFVVSGRQESIFFGLDPLVTITRFLISGVSSGQDDHPPHCRWEAKNDHLLPVKVLIEESLSSSATAGKSRSSASAVAASAEEQPGLWVGRLDIPAGGNKALLHHSNLIPTAASVPRNPVLTVVPPARE